MDVVVFFNGLGNQMSQYAFYLSKKEVEDSTKYIDICKEHNGLELNRVFNLKIEKTVNERFMFLIFKILISHKLRVFKNAMQKIGIKSTIVEEKFDYNFNEDYLSPSEQLTFYYGGWPSEKYFSKVKDKVIKSFIFPKFDDEKNIDCEMEMQSTNSIALHVRRGDYLTPENLELFGRVCTKQYFEMAIQLISNKLNDPHFYIFSNDIPWVKDNLKIKKYTIVDFNFGNDSWKDMALMSKCKHNIISNSTFSWWGAYLNANPNKIVISPSKYLNNDTKTDFYPENWVRLENY